MSVSRYKDLDGKHALVTGGSSGIGAAIVRALLLQGAKVSILDLLTPEPNIVSDCRAELYAFQRCDLRDPTQLEVGITNVRELLGDIDILINNVARDDRHTLAETDSTVWDDLIAINLRAAYLSTRGVVPDMLAAGGGTIVNISSNAFLLGLQGYPVYVTAKAGIWGMTKALAREFGPSGIRVNCLVPGWVRTRRQEQQWMTNEALNDCLAAQCLKQVIEPEDIANACLFLASAASRFITGQMLIVDGGRF